MRAKGVSENAEGKRRSIAVMAKAALKPGERASGQCEETPGGELLLGGRKKPALKLADAMKSKAKKRAFAKQQLEEARVVVLDCLPTIVKALSAKSAKSYLTAKFLFDFAELEKVSVSMGNPGRPRSLKAVLKKLGFEDPKVSG